MKPLLHSLLIALTLALGLTPQASSAAEITQFEQALAGIPREVLVDLRQGSRKMTEATFSATEQARKNVKDKTGVFKITVRNVEKFTPTNAPGTVRYRVFAMAEKVRESGTPFNAFLVTMPATTENDKAARLQKGDKLTVTGKILSAQVYGSSHAGLEIMIIDAKLD